MLDRVYQMSVILTLVRVRVEIPQLCRYYDDPNRLAVMVHPPVDCRARDLLLTMALARLEAYPLARVAFHAPEGDVALLRLALRKSWASLGLRCHRVEDGVEAYVLDATGSTLWLCADRAAPVERVHLAVASSAHLLQLDVVAAYPDATRYRLAGAMPDSWHWLYRRLPEASTHYFPWEHVVDRWPALAAGALRRDDPYYRRRMLLEDVAPDFSVRFLQFARERLHIRSDKPLKALSERQRAVAAGQLGTPVVPFDLSRLQRRYVAYKRLVGARAGRRWFILLKYRRGGFTTLEQAQSYVTATTRPRSYVVTLAHTVANTQRIFGDIVSTMYENDPKALPLAGESKRQLEFANKSLFFVGTAGGRGFRGDTLQRAHGSEVAKWCAGPRQLENVAELMGGLLGAASHGEVVLESTPNGREWFYQTYVEAKAGQNEFTPIFLPWHADPNNRLWPGQYDEDELIDTLTAQEAEWRAQYGLDAGQLAWYREQKRVYGVLVQQEHPFDDASCFLTSGTCFFDVEVLLQWLETHAEETGDRHEIGGGYEVRWRAPEAGHRYVAGVDTSEGLPGGDLNGVGIVDKDTGEQVAAIHGRFAPRELAEHAVRLSIAYNNALLAVERENHGHAVLQRVVDLGYRKPHFRGGPLYYFQRGRDVKASRVGWSTNSQTRPVMLDNLAAAIVDGGLVINDRQFVDECLSFRRQANGRFEADGATHDDCVMKWAIAWAMVEERQDRPHITLIDRSGSNGVARTPPERNGDDGVVVTVRADGYDREL